MRRLQTARAIEPNQGVTRAYQKKILRLQADFRRFIVNQLFLYLDDSGVLAQDFSLSKPTTLAEKEQLRKIQRRVLSSIAKSDPEWLKNHLESFISKNIGWWTNGLNKSARKLAEWFVRNQVTSVTNAQKSALKAAGFNVDILKDKWSVPVVGRSYVSPQVAKQMPDIIDENASLITKITADDVQRISDVIQQGLTGGDNLSKLRETLADTEGFNAGRVQRVVADQVHKANNATLTANAQSLGISEGIWKHVPGKYTSRETHKAFDGQRFNLNEGLFDSDVGRNVKCGELPYCRCVWRMVIPDWFKKENDK